MSNRVPVVSPRSAASIERITRDILSRFGPGTLRGEEPFNVIGFVDGKLQQICDVEFEVQDLGPTVEGKLVSKTLILSTSVYEGALLNRFRDRFTTAHECGHAVLHADQLEHINEFADLPTVCRNRQEIKPYLDPEWQANIFAGSLLMPVEGVRSPPAPK